MSALTIRCDGYSQAPTRLLPDVELRTIPNNAGNSTFGRTPGASRSRLGLSGGFCCEVAGGAEFECAEFVVQEWLDCLLVDLYTAACVGLSSSDYVGVSVLTNFVERGSCCCRVVALVHAVHGVTRLFRWALR